MLADLLPHLMVGTPTPTAPPVAQASAQPSAAPTPVLQSNQPIGQQAMNGHHMMQPNGRAPHANPAVSAAKPPPPKQQAVRPAQNSTPSSGAQRQTVQAPAARCGSTLSVVTS